MGNEVFGIRHYAVKQLHTMMTFCLISVSKTISELDVIITLLQIALFFLNIVMNNGNDLFIHEHVCYI